MRNSIFVIKPYLWNGLWVFDDPDVGLVREPFVAGVPEMIERATNHIPDAENGFVAVFSGGYFPDATIVLQWVREEGGGNVYRWPESGQEGWLCPALLKYFEKAPDKLYLQVRPVPDHRQYNDALGRIETVCAELLSVSKRPEAG